VVRMPGRVIGQCGLALGLMLLQPVIAIIAKSFGETGATTSTGQLVFGLHAVNALVIMSVLRGVLQQARALPAAPRTTPSGADGGSPARSVS
jgi:hypothetical protein